MARNTDFDIDTSNYGGNGPGIISIAFGIALGWGLIQFFKTGSAASIIFFAKWWLVTLLALFGFIVALIIIGLIIYAIYLVATQ